MNKFLFTTGRDTDKIPQVSLKNKKLNLNSGNQFVSGIGIYIYI